MLKALKNFKWGYILLTILLAAVGVCLISMNDALVTLAITIGCMLAATGAVISIFALADKRRGPGFAIKMTVAVICLIGGIVTAVFNAASIEIIVSIFSLILIIDASFKLNTTAMSKRYSLALWWVMLALSLLIISSSFFMIKYTPENINVTSIVLGVIFIVDSVANFLNAFFVTVYEKRQREDILAEENGEHEEENDDNKVEEE